MHRVKWGVIGCGGIADRRTLPGMMLADNAELVAVMDTDPAAAERCKTKYNARYAFTDVDSLLALDEIEAVYIATPVFCHKPQVFAAADKGKAILLEKPVGLTVAEAEEIKAHCDKKGVKVGVGFVIRNHSVHLKVKDMIKDGKLGDIVSARAQLTCWYPTQDGVWRQDPKKSGGGALMDMGIHCVDLIRSITGLEVTEVSGMTGNQIFDYAVEDAGAVLMRLENGATAYVDANFNIPDDAASCKLEFYGTKGSVFADGTVSQVDAGTARVVLLDNVGGYDAMQAHSASNVTELRGENTDMYRKEVEDFGKAVLNEGEIPVTLTDAIKAQKVIEAAYESSKQHRALSLRDQ